MEQLLLYGALGLAWAICSFTLGYLTRIAVERFWPSPSAENAPEDEQDVLDVIQGLQRSVKLLQGRVNNISPPRTGTGKTNGEPGEPEPVAVQGGPTRAQVLAAFKAGGRR